MHVLDGEQYEPAETVSHCAACCCLKRNAAADGTESLTQDSCIGREMILRSGFPSCLPQRLIRPFAGRMDIRLRVSSFL